MHQLADRVAGQTDTPSFPNEEAAGAPAFCDLTKRESEIMHWLTEGKRDREIACIIGVSHRTVHHHVEHILQKLCVETRTAAARLALARGGLGRPIFPQH